MCAQTVGCCHARLACLRDRFPSSCGWCVVGELCADVFAALCCRCCLPVQEPASAALGGAGPAYMRELSLLQRNTAAGAFSGHHHHPVADVVVRHLPGMSEDAAEAAADAPAPRTGAAGVDAAGSAVVSPRQQL
jgi:hypothetical protein